MAAPTDMVGLTAIADEVIAAQISGQILLLLADRNALPNHPALRYVGEITGIGSNAIKVPAVGMMGYDLMATGTEGDPVANTALTDSSATITVVQKTKVYEPSDIARIVDRQGFLKREALAMDAVLSGMATQRSMIANITDDFTATVTNSGVDATFAQALDCVTTLEIAKVEGPYMGILHPVQWGDIRKDVATASGGAIQFNAGSQALLDGMKGLGYKGNWIGVDWFTTTDVPTANSAADRAGGVFGNGAVLWADGTPVVDNPLDQYLLAGKVLFERGRVVAGGTTKWASHRYIGVGIGINAAGVSLITDA